MVVSENGSEDKAVSTVTTVTTIYINNMDRGTYGRVQNTVKVVQVVSPRFSSALQ